MECADKWGKPYSQASPSLIPRPPQVSFPGLPKPHSKASPSLVPGFVLWFVFTICGESRGAIITWMKLGLSFFSYFSVSMYYTGRKPNKIFEARLPNPQQSPHGDTKYHFDNHWGTQTHPDEIFHLYMVAHGLLLWKHYNGWWQNSHWMSHIVWSTKRLFRLNWIGAMQVATRHSMSLGLPWCSGMPVWQHSEKRLFILNLLRGAKLEKWFHWENCLATFSDCSQQPQNTLLCSFQ